MPDLLGAHMSIAGGVYRALERGLEVGCSVVQIFLKNQLQWTAAPYTEEDIRRFSKAWKATRMRTVFAHSSYLINLAAPAAAEWKRAVAAFHDELERAEALGLPFVIIHPGSHRGEGLEAGIGRIVAALDELTARTRGYRVMVLLENTAGGGATIGRTFEELEMLLDAVKVPERVGVCLDTCHLVASGYDIVSEAGYRETLEDFDRLVGFDRLLVFHGNDSKKPCASRVDRHEHIGRGWLGTEPFRRLLHDPRFTDLPLLIETEKSSRTTRPDTIAADPLDVMNLTLLRRLREG